MTNQARVLVVSAWQEDARLLVRLVAADEPQANPIILDGDGALAWFGRWLDLGRPAQGE